MKRFLVAVAMATAAALVFVAAGVTSAQTSGDRGPSKTNSPEKTKAGSGPAKPGGTRPRRGGRRKREAVVVLDDVTDGPIVETTPVYGRIVARQTGVVAARTEGGVETVHVEVGDRVEKGDPLVTLVANVLTAERNLKAAEVAEYRSKIKTAKAQLNIGKQELARLQKLRRSAAFSAARFQDKQQDVERLKSSLGEVRAKVDQAMAQLQKARIDLDNATIRAPYPGVVSKRHTEVGAYIDVGDEVVTLVNDTALEVEAEVPSARLGGLRKGTIVTVTLEIGGTFEAAFRAVVPEENPLARTRTVRLVPRFAAPPPQVAANQSVILNIPTGPPKQAVSVHKDAVVQRQGSPSVFVYEKDKVALRPVRLGEAFGIRFEVLDGLRPGEKVVVRGNERLRDGQRVRDAAS